MAGNTRFGSERAEMRRLYSTICLVLMLCVAAAADECHLCRRTSPPYPLEKVRYTEAGVVSRLVCQSCQKEKAACSICAGPTTAKAEMDGRFICPDCKKVAIDTPAEAESLYKEVQTFVHTLTGVKVDATNVPIRLVQSDELETRFVETSGRSFRAHAFYRPYNPEIIYVLTGHSAYDLGPTLAHEYTHAWQSRLCPPQDRMVTEGFATWVGYKYALSKGYSHQAQQMLRRTDPDYGEGLRRCLEIEKKSGIKGLVEFVRKASKFP